MAGPADCLFFVSLHADSVSYVVKFHKAIFHALLAAALYAISTPFSKLLLTYLSPTMLAALWPNHFLSPYKKTSPLAKVCLAERLHTSHGARVIPLSFIYAHLCAQTFDIKQVL